jgi:hypothetical protein
MEKLFAALIPVLCVVAFGPLFSAKIGAVADRKSADEAPEGGGRSGEAPLCEVSR